MENLLQKCTSGGCGAKIGPQELSGLLAGLPTLHDERLLVGFGAADDAAVYRLGPDTALVSTVDFFPPMVEDPYLFGEIAAANALSDVYAMGGTPLYALNLVCFPAKMDKAALAEMLRGGAEKVREAGALLAGGHSIYGHEPKYGLAVTGLVHPEKVLRNNTPCPGDCLVLTKPLGTGLVMAALRGGAAQSRHVEAAAGSMRRLNRYAAEKMAAYRVNACTDITGFGLAVHAAEMAGEMFTLTIDTAALPLLPGAAGYAADFLATAAGQRNRNFMAGKINLGAIPAPMQELIFDPQTSGGLLISLPAKSAQALCTDIRGTGGTAAIVGLVATRGAAAIDFL